MGLLYRVARLFHCHKNIINLLILLWQIGLLADLLIINFDSFVFIMKFGNTNFNIFNKKLLFDYVLHNFFIDWNFVPYDYGAGFTTTKFKPENNFRYTA